MPAEGNPSSPELKDGAPSRPRETRAAGRKRSVQYEELRLLHESLGNLLRETHLAYLKVLREKLRTFGINTAQWYFLRALWIEDGLIHRELSERTTTSRATATTTLQVMERDGYIKRVTCPEERRLVRFFLTDKAKALKDETRLFTTEVDAVSLQSASPEQIEATRTLLLQMRRNLLSHVPAPATPPRKKTIHQ